MARTNTKAKSNRRARPARSRAAGKRAARARRARPQGRGRAQSRSAATSTFTTMARRLADVAKKMTEMMTQKAEAEDAVALLEQDHRDVESFLDQFEQADDNSMKHELARQICLALTVHAEVEERLFYPTARKQGDEGLKELVDEAEVEHALAKQLIAEIEPMTPRDRLFEAKVKVLGEYVKHHVKEEENELFPKVRNTGIDLVALGKKMKELKMSLLKQMSGRG